VVNPLTRGMVDPGRGTSHAGPTTAVSPGSAGPSRQKNDPWRPRDKARVARPNMDDPRKCGSSIKGAEAPAGRLKLPIPTVVRSHNHRPRREPV